MLRSDRALGQAAADRREAPSFSVIAPCYNEEEAVTRFLNDLRDALEGAGPYEVVLVDDGSTDGTPELLAAEVAGDATLRVVRHGRNRGYGAALKTGLRHSTAEVVVITDVDGSYPPQAIPELLARMGHADMVVGSRAANEPGHLASRRLPKAMLTAWASAIVGSPIPDLNSGLRAFRKEIASRFLRVLPDGFSFTSTLTLAMMRNRYRVEYLPVPYAARLGSSKIHPVRDTLQIVQLILRTGMYFAPLRVLAPVVGALGLVFLARLAYDLVVLRGVTDTSILLLFFTFNTAMFALLADMIDRRSSG